MSTPINGNGKRSFKLMIVDDSNIMRRRIERSQQFEDLQLVGTAGNGFEALELFKKTDPDVVTKFKQLGTVPYPEKELSPEAHARLFAADLPRVAKLVEASGARPSEAQ